MFRPQIAFYEIHSTGLLPIKNHDINTLKTFIQSGKQIWIDVIGINPWFIHDLVQNLNLHTSIEREIIYLRDQRPKVEILDDYVYWISREHQYFENNQFRLKKVCTILGVNFVITICESKFTAEKALKSYIHDHITKISEPHADYFALLLLNQIVDETFVKIDAMTEELEELEELVMESPKQFQLKDIYSLKRKILFLTKLTNPIIEIAHALKIEKINFIHPRTKMLIRKIYDNCLRARENLELYQQMINNIYDMYLSTTNFYTNRSITLLTQFSTVFIPISFIASVYGMNFKHMPELNYPYAYPIVMGACTMIAVGIWFYFKRTNK
jgi:magnesium transporter